MVAGAASEAGKVKMSARYSATGSVWLADGSGRSRSGPIPGFAGVALSCGAVQSEMGHALGDGVITPAEQQRIEEAAAALDRANEELRLALAAAKGNVIRITG